MNQPKRNIPSSLKEYYQQAETEESRLIKEVAGKSYYVMNMTIYYLKQRLYTKSTPNEAPTSNNYKW